MLPLDLIRREPDAVKRAAQLKGETAPVDEILELDREWRAHLHGAETVKAEQNQLSKEFARTRDEALKERLQSRAQDSADVVRQRMAKSSDEMSHWAEYDYVIINDDLDSSVRQVQAILDAERKRRTRQVGLSDFVNALRTKA